MSGEKGNWDNLSEVQAAVNGHKRLAKAGFQAIEWNGGVQPTEPETYASAEWTDKRGVAYELNSVQSTRNPHNPEAIYREYHLMRTLKNGVVEYYFFESDRPYIDRFDEEMQPIETDGSEQTPLTKKVTRWLRTCPRPEWIKDLDKFDSIIEGEFSSES